MSKFPGLTLSIPLFFEEDGRIDYSSLEKYIYNLASSKQIAALYSMAYNTRYRALDFDEVLDLNKFILARAHEISIECYVGHPYSFNERSLSKYLAEIAKSRPAGISMLYPERYFGMSEPIIEFIAFTDQFGLKSVIHEMKLVSGFNGELIDWPLELVQEAMSLRNVVAIKEDSKSDVITDLVLNESLKNNIKCVLAGGGKRRAIQFIDRGLTTWLNGTTMFFPQAIDKIYLSIMERNEKLTKFYCENIEAVFFDEIAARRGWHLAHKAALQYFNFGPRWERFPHAVMAEADYLAEIPILARLQASIDEFLDM